MRRLNVADLGAIETRVVAWLSGCEPLLNVFREGRDPYLDFAVKLSQIPYEVLEKNIHSKDLVLKGQAKRHRQIAKPGVLGCCYRLSGGQMGVDKNGDPVKQGLWGYAEAMGVEMTQEQAHQVVKIFRDSYKEIVEFWYALESAVKEVLSSDSKIKRKLGPNDSLEIDMFVFTCNGDQRAILRIHLPSGRYLNYLDASIEETKMPWQKDGEDVYKPTLCYAGQDQTTKQWTSITSHGGKLCENVTQGVARDILCEKLLTFEDSGLPVVAHVHDEGVCETLDDLFEAGSREMKYIMSQSVAWAPDLPLAAEAFETKFYHK